MNTLSIKELPVDDRPREKMLRKGASALSNAELIAILIGSGTREETAVQLSQRILNSTGNNLNELSKLTIKTMTVNFKGIGEAKAVTIAAALELGRRRSASVNSDTPSIRTSKEAHGVFYPFLCDISHEEVWIAVTNAKNKVTGTIKISQGGISGTTVDVRMIMHAAIQSLAAGIILCHNHPSGNPQPSSCDDAMTVRIGEASRIMGIKFLDHIIISEHIYYSYADEGRISSYQ
jgi:DNA repair protein RadC